MDIKPYISQYPDWLSLLLIPVAIIFLILFFITVVKADEGEYEMKDAKKVAKKVSILIFIGSTLMISAYVHLPNKVLDNASMQSHKNEQLSNLEEEGFQVIHENLNLFPGAKSFVELKYGDGDVYLCEVSTPKYSERSVDFECGKENLNLQEVKER